MNLNKKESGFTLIEIIITLAILGIVSTAAASLIGTMRHMEKDSDTVQNANVLIQNTIDNIKAMSMDDLKEYTDNIKNSKQSNPFTDDYDNESKSGKILNEITFENEVFKKIENNYKNSKDFKVYSTDMKDIYIAVRIPNADHNKLGIDIESNSDKAGKEYWFDKDKADGIITFKKDSSDHLTVEIKNKNLDNPTSDRTSVVRNINEDKYLRVINTFEDGIGSKLSYNTSESEICINIINGEESERNIYIENKAGDSELVVKVENKVNRDLNIYIENTLEERSKLQLIPKGDNIKIHSKNSSEGKYGSYEFKNVCEIIVDAYYVDKKTDKPKLIHSIKTYKIIDKD